MNAAFAAMLGIDAATALGARVTEVFPGVASDPADWIGRFGRVRPLVDVVAYRPAPGRFAVIAQDISERKRLEAEVGELRAMLASR